ncbi:tyrosine-type recombinase/integrase [Arthrobacter agilis]|uniref:tyrosine-type recombinase/integrase n=1 Tax=Arthrobacter agilis TaxID=37921 RepID=UPI0027871777|nr:site-specific integrase [Arthrobacter agilis]MDQ0735138.1 integrase [Arthrobacter agilis]
MASIEDRWTRANPDGGPPKRVRRERYGQGLRWRVHWDEGGKRSKSFSTKDAAEAFLTEVNARTHPGIYTAPARALLISEYAARWQEQQIHQRASSREQIARRMNRSILPVLGHKRMESVTRTDVQAAVIGWSETLAASTVKLTYTYLAGMMKAAVLDGVIRATPCVGMRLPRDEVERVRPLSTDTVRALVEAIWAPYRPLVVFGAATGLRGSEMRGLTWDRVNLSRGSVTVDRQLVSRDAGRPAWGPPETASSVRTISIGPATIAMLEDLPRVGELVFTAGGRALTRGNAGDAWRDARAKVPGIGDGFHQLRHYHASQLIAGGMSPVAVAHRLGHKDATETLQTYAHLWHDDDQRAATLTDGVVAL